MVVLDDLQAEVLRQLELLAGLRRTRELSRTCGLPGKMLDLSIFGNTAE
jgi:hypothetical protein